MPIYTKNFEMASHVTALLEWLTALAIIDKCAHVEKGIGMALASPLMLAIYIRRLQMTDFINR